MNKTQLEYAVRRLDSSAQEKASVIRDKYTKKSPTFDGDALVKAIKDGKLKLKEGRASKHIDHYDDLRDIFDLRQFIKEDVKDATAIAKACEPLFAEVTRIRDQLFLGDAKEALALIEAFEGRKFA